MKGWTRYWTHLVGALLAFAVTLALRRPAGEVAADRSGDATESPVKRQAAHASAEPALKGRSSGDLAAAWDELAKRRMSRWDRFSLQVEILQRWGERDLEAAMAAALAEPWDEGGNGSRIEELLEQGFKQVILDRPDDMWKMIQGKKFGILESALVRRAWASVLCAGNPDLFFTYLPEMKGAVLRGALEAAGSAIKSDEQAVLLWEQLSKKDDWMGGSSEIPDGLLIRLQYMIPEESLLSAMHDGREPMASLSARALALRENLNGGSVDFAGQVANVPESVAGAYALESMKLTHGNRAKLMERFEFLVGGSHWPELADPAAAAKVKEMARLMPSQELAEWVESLPARAETTSMFHRGVEPFIREDPAAAWDWISGMDDGLWRDRAFAEYSQQSLHQWKDLAKSREALDQIADPEFRAVAEQWRANWARNNGVEE